MHEAVHLRFREKLEQFFCLGRWPLQILRMRSLSPSPSITPSRESCNALPKDSDTLGNRAGRSLEHDTTHSLQRLKAQSPPEPRKPYQLFALTRRAFGSPFAFKLEAAPPTDLESTPMSYSTTVKPGVTAIWWTDSARIVWTAVPALHVRKLLN